MRIFRNSDRKQGDPPRQRRGHKEKLYRIWRREREYPPIIPVSAIRGTVLAGKGYYT